MFVNKIRLYNTLISDSFPIAKPVTVSLKIKIFLKPKCRKRVSEKYQKVSRIIWMVNLPFLITSRYSFVTLYESFNVFTKLFNPISNYRMLTEYIKYR